MNKTLVTILGIAALVFTVNADFTRMTCSIDDDANFSCSVP